MIFDIDGTLTDGRIFWVPNSGWTQMYSVRDGMGIKRLQEAGLEVAADDGGDRILADHAKLPLCQELARRRSQDSATPCAGLRRLLRGRAAAGCHSGRERQDPP